MNVLILYLAIGLFISIMSHVSSRFNPLTFVIVTVGWLPLAAWLLIGKLVLR